jgi:hypothetical protein
VVELISLNELGMANLNQIIDYTQLFQDVELATAVGQLKQNPAQLQQFLQGQQGKIYEDVVKQKDSTFQKVYGDLNRASQAQEAILMLDKRNQELVDITEQIYNNQKGQAGAVTDDKNLSGRKYEMNQWSVGNKNDTLFVFSSLFILLSSLTLLTVLWKMGMLGGGAVGGLSAILIIIFVLIVIYRSNFTNVWRDNRYWNRVNYSGKYGKIPVPLCPGALSGIESGLGSLQSDIQSGISSAGQAIASGAQTVAQDVSSATQSVAGAVQGTSSASVQNAAPASIPAAAPMN